MSNKEYTVKQEYELDVDLAERDRLLEQIENQIKEKKGSLLEKRKTLTKTAEQNQFLLGVKKDYQKYFEYIMMEKRKQAEAFSILNKHLDQVIVSGKLTEREIQDSRSDQERILKELDKVKKSLDELMEGP